MDLSPAGREPEGKGLKLLNLMHFLIVEFVKTWGGKIGALSCGAVKSCLGYGAVSCSESVEMTC